MLSQIRLETIENDLKVGSRNFAQHEKIISFAVV